MTDQTESNNSNNQSETTNQSELEEAIEILNATDGWTDEFRGEYKLSCGADFTGITITKGGVTLHGHEKFGDGQTPYALDPSYHETMLSHEDCTHGEGVVVYYNIDSEKTTTTSDETEQLRLPKQLYFEEEREFDTEVTTVAELGRELNKVLDLTLSLDFLTELSES